MGSSISFTVTLNEQVPIFPASSVAVTVATVTPTLNVEPDAGTATVVATEQLSVAAGKVKFTTASHELASLSTSILSGQLATGFSPSFTVIVNVQSSILLDVSVAVTVTVVTPTGKVEPDAKSETSDRILQLSVDKPRSKSTTASHEPESVKATISVGQIAVGSSASTTTISILHETELSPSSVAVTVTAVIPTPNSEPEGIDSTTVVVQLSVTVYSVL